ncbi:MAG: 50S ribosomal protein L9 [Armatimonadota bacterium]|nr:50S ribosomal protein L9 [Armatimonadota bacterium]
MKAILIRDVKDLGGAGDVVSVADGYARNFLIPRRLAIEATAGSLKALDRQRSMEGNKSEKQLDNAQQIAARLGEISVTIVGKTGEGTRLYGSVTGQDIADALKAQHGIEVDKRKIDVIEPIKSLGSYTVPIRLARTVTADLKIEVTSENAPAPKSAEKPKKEPVAKKPRAKKPVQEETAAEPVAEETAEPEAVATEEVAAEAVEPAQEAEQTEESEQTEQPKG